MKFSILTWLIIIPYNSLFQHKTQEDQYFQGYDEEISGKRFGYHSIFPNVTTSLLLRGQTDYEPISWKTEIVPEDYSENLSLSSGCSEWMLLPILLISIYL